MNEVDKYSNRTYTFFDHVNRLITVNLVTMFLCLFIIPLLPALSAAIMTINGDDSIHIIKRFFTNLFKIGKKASLAWLFMLVAIGLAFFGISFYQQTSDFFSQMGVGFMIIILILILFILLHLPFIFVYYPTYTIYDSIRMALFIALRYFHYTIGILLTVLLTIITLPLLPISLLFGITGPLLLAIKLTKSLYDPK